MDIDISHGYGFGMAKLDGFVLVAIPNRWGTCGLTQELISQRCRPRSEWLSSGCCKSRQQCNMSISWHCANGSRHQQLWAYRLLLVASLHDGECGRCTGRCSRQPWWRLTSTHGGATSPCRTAINSGDGPLSPSASMVRVPRATNFNSTAATIGKALPSSSTRAHCLAPRHYATRRHEGASAGHCCDLLQVAIHVLPFRPGGVHRIKVTAHVQVQCTKDVHLILWGQKIQIKKTISRDIKVLSSRCLILVHVESVFGHPSCCSSRTSYLSRRGVVSGPI
jgi:hypothetical protein